jgi:serine-type D-Ala-D-Ala carboxypeptidase/endopeptidase
VGQSFQRSVAVGALGICLMSMSAHAGLLPERVEKAAQDRIAAGTYRTLVVGFVNGDKIEVVGFGKLEDGQSPDGDTVYEIGSITKTFTATLLARAVLAGRTALETPVRRLVPDFSIPSRIDKEITLVEIATHYSGLPRMPSNFAPRDPANPYADYDAARMKAFLSRYNLPRDPGASYEYSNLGFGLLGYALAQSIGKSYDALAADVIFKPLGMTMSSTALTDAMRARLAPGHDGMGKPVKNWDIDALAGAGAIRSTPNDMLRYLRANMGLDRSALTDAMKFAQQPRREMTKTARVGLAWITTDKDIVWHSGMTGGYASFLGFTADGQRGVIVLADAAVSADDLGFAALDADAPLAPAFKAITLQDAALDGVTGTYKLSEAMLLQVFRINDGLFARASGQTAFPIYPSEPDEFFARIAGISISFTRNPSGSVSGLVLHQNGDRSAPKLGPSELPPELRETELDAALIGDYVGKYRFSFGVLDVVQKGDHLDAQLTGQSALPIYANAKDKFFYKVVDAQLVFERDATEKIVAAILHQNGKVMRAPRLPTP